MAVAEKGACRSNNAGIWEDELSAELVPLVSLAYDDDGDLRGKDPGSPV